MKDFQNSKYIEPNASDKVEFIEILKVWFPLRWKNKYYDLNQFGEDEKYMIHHQLHFFSFIANIKLNSEEAKLVSCKLQVENRHLLSIWITEMTAHEAISLQQRNLNLQWDNQHDQKFFSHHRIHMSPSSLCLCIWWYLQLNNLQRNWESSQWTV